MKFFSKLFGMDEILNRLNDINKRLGPEIQEGIMTDSINFVDPVDKSSFLSIESMFNYDKGQDTQIKKPIGNADKLLALIQHLPIAQNIAQSKALEGAYKVVLPEGAVGKLIQYKNGTYGTPLVQPNGQFGNTHAGMLPIENMAISPVLVFTALSAVTGQYFMAKINKSLENISKDVKEIIWMMLDDKEARNEAIYNFFSYVRGNLDLIISNSDLKIATLTNLQSYIVELNQNQIFYEKTINRKNQELDSIIKDYKTTNKRVSEIDKLVNKVTNLLIQQHICLELYVIGKIYEMQLAQIYDDNYCNRLISELNNNVIKAVKFNERITDKYIELLDKVEDKAFINKDKVNEQKNEININIVERQKAFEENVKSTIGSISEVISLNKKEQTFIIDEGNLYYLENNIA